MRAVMAKMQARNVLIAIYSLEGQGRMVLTGWGKKVAGSLGPGYGTEFPAYIALLCDGNASRAGENGRDGRTAPVKPESGIEWGTTFEAWRGTPRFAKRGHEAATLHVRSGWEKRQR